MVKKKTTKKTKVKTVSRSNKSATKNASGCSKTSKKNSSRHTSRPKTATQESRNKPQKATDKIPKKRGPDPIPVPEDAGRQLETMAAMGLTVQQMAAIIGVGKATLERWLKANDELMVVVERGRAKSLLSVARTAYDMAVSGKVPVMTMFYLKCRGGWKETQRHEHTGKVNLSGDGLALADIDKMSDEEVEDELKRLEGPVQT